MRRPGHRPAKGTELDRDRDRHTVTVSGGETIGYDKLLLTMCASPRHLPVPGADLDGVLYLGRVGDCERIKRTFQLTAQVAEIVGENGTVAGAPLADPDVPLAGQRRAGRARRMPPGARGQARIGRLAPQR